MRTNAKDVTQTRKASARVINCDADAERLQTVDTFTKTRVVLDEGVFRDLDNEAFTVVPEAKRFDLGKRSGERRQIHGEVFACAQPRQGLERFPRQRQLKIHRTLRHASLLEPDIGTASIVEARERFVTDNGAGLQCADRLQRDAETVICQQRFDTASDISNGLALFNGYVVRQRLASRVFGGVTQRGRNQAFQRLQNSHVVRAVSLHPG